VNQKVSRDDVKKIIDGCTVKKRAVIVRKLVYVYKISERQARRLFNQMSENV
jgi:hypothetical protein